MKKDMSQPWGLSNSLVPEVRITSGINLAPEVPACKSGGMPKVEQSTMNHNNSFQDLKSTGRS